VIVWDANAENYQSHRDEQLLYTICSRAMHRLLVVAKGQLSPLIAKIPESLYQTIN
jgi:DNA helicase-2/ATP-dependent DNA helicase PcrA